MNPRMHQTFDPTQADAMTAPLQCALPAQPQRDWAGLTACPLNATVYARCGHFFMPTSKCQ